MRLTHTCMASTPTTPPEADTDPTYPGNKVAASTARADTYADEEQGGGGSWINVGFRVG